MPLITVMQHANVVADVFDAPLTLDGVNKAINIKIPGVKKTIAAPMIRCVHTAVLSSGTFAFVEDEPFEEVHSSPNIVFEPTQITVDNRLRNGWNHRTMTLEEYRDAMRIRSDLLFSNDPILVGDQFSTALHAIATESADYDHVLLVSDADALGSIANLVGKSVCETDGCGFITTNFNGAWHYVSSHGVQFID